MGSLLRIKLGGSRFVILWGSHAIKVARIRPWWYIKHIARQRAQLDPHLSLLRDAWCGMTAGVAANAQEWAYWNVTRDRRVIPTTQIFLGGWVIIQPRGEPVGAELFFHPLYRQLEQAFWLPEHDLLGKLKQFCYHCERPVIVDYGREAIYRLLLFTKQYAEKDFYDDDGGKEEEGAA